MYPRSMQNITPSPVNPEITTYTAGVLQSAVNRSLQKLCDTTLHPYGLTKTQWIIVGTILDAGPDGIRLSDLAVKLDTTVSYLTNAVNLLESKDFLVRKAGPDNRSKLISVHEDFVPLCHTIESELRVHLRRHIYSQVPEKDFRTYMKVLHILAATGENSHSSPA